MNTFVECLRGWMQENAMNASSLTSALNYKSKTTIARVLTGRYTYNGARKIYISLDEKGLMSDVWKTRFEQALKVERNGKLEYEMMLSIDSMLYGKAAAAKQPFCLPVDFSELLIIGCPWEDTSRMIQAAIERNPEIIITHYLTDQEIHGHSTVIPLLMTHLMDFQYQAVEIPEHQMPAGMTRHIVLGKEKENGYEYVLIAAGPKLEWSRVDHSIHLYDLYETELSRIERTALYRNDLLRSGTDYIRFMQESYQMEKTHAAVIIKPSLGIQMLPIKLVISAFDDYMKESGDPVYACRTTLIYTLQKRVENFTKLSKPLDLFLSQSSLEEFVRTGKLTDQFYATRAYTIEERLSILEALLVMARKPNVSIRFLKRKKEFAFSCEAYENTGVLIYPSRTNYRSEAGKYRELFVPEKMYYPFFKRFAQEIADGEDCMNTEESEKLLMRYYRSIL